MALSQREKKKALPVKEGLLLLPDAILGLHSPVYGGHRSGLKPDAKAERVQRYFNLLQISCQV